MTTKEEYLKRYLSKTDTVNPTQDTNLRNKKKKIRRTDKPFRLVLAVCHFLNNMVFVYQSSRRSRGGSLKRRSQKSLSITQR